MTRKVLAMLSCLYREFEATVQCCLHLFHSAFDQCSKPMQHVRLPSVLQTCIRLTSGPSARGHFSLRASLMPFC